MKKAILLFSALLIAQILAGCFSAPFAPETEVLYTTGPVPEETAEVTEAAQTDHTEALHSPLYIPGLEAEQVLLYFNETVLSAEYIHSGDPSFLQKWTIPIRYMLHGEYTDEDLAVLDSFVGWLNAVEGFPGIQETHQAEQANLNIHFCSQEEMISILGQDFYGLDGAVTFWYTNDEIYRAVICCRKDLRQSLRNSVLLEELYNGLGPIQDTVLRSDSIIYSEYSEPQALSDVDELILKLLYHPDMRCGMDASECEDVIRQLYY